MPTRSDKSATTWLMFVGLAVVAFIGVFGIPQFAPVVASPADDPDQNGFGEFGLRHEIGVGESTRQGADDLFAPFSDDSTSTAVGSGDPFATIDSGRSGQSTTPTHSAAEPRRRPTGFPPEAFEGWQPESGQLAPIRTADLPNRISPDPDKGPEEQSRRNPYSAPMFDRADFSRRSGPQAGKLLAVGDDDHRGDHRRLSLPASFTAASTSENEPAAADLHKPLSWRLAVQRLNELGIQHFQLSAGERPYEFHFSCFLTPADNPRVRRLFEAEADEPLRAVEKVLAQIDDWIRQSVSGSVMGALGDQ